MRATPESARIGTLDVIWRELDDFPLAPPLREKVRNHYEDLAKLATTLRKLGLEEQEIDHHVIELFNGYRVELLRSIERMKSAGSNSANRAWSPRQ